MYPDTGQRLTSLTSGFLLWQYISSPATLHDWSLRSNNPSKLIHISTFDEYFELLQNVRQEWQNLVKIMQFTSNKVYRFAKSGRCFRWQPVNVDNVCLGQQGNWGLIRSQPWEEKSFVTIKQQCNATIQNGMQPAWTTVFQPLCIPVYLLQLLN